jgi:hypothetical protein
VAGAPPAALHSGGAIVDETGIMTDGAGEDNSSSSFLLQIKTLMQSIFAICTAVRLVLVSACV